MYGSSWSARLLCLGALALGATCPTPGENSDVSEAPAARALPELAQRLMDAVTRGDAEVWRRYLSDRAVYVTEAGERADKAELVKELRPLPPGLGGSLTVKDPHVEAFGNTAVIVFDAFEQEQVYGQSIEVTYRTTGTWHRERGRWRMIASQTVVVAKDPPPLPTDTTKLADYAGTYELVPDRRYRVERRGDSLVGGREGGELATLIPVGDNVFADAGSNLGIIRIFVRGHDGSVERMVQRRKFADISWVRVTPAQASDRPKD